MMVLAGEKDLVLADTMHATFINTVGALFYNEFIYTRYMGCIYVYCMASLSMTMT